MLVVGYAELALEPREGGEPGRRPGAAAHRRAGHGSAVEVDEQRHEAEEEEETRRGEPGGSTRPNPSLAILALSQISAFARDLKPGGLWGSQRPGGAGEAGAAPGMVRSGL